MKLAENCFHFDKSDPAKFRQHVLSHGTVHGYRAAVDAFGISKTTYFRWKKGYEDSGKKLRALVPKNTAPKTTRRMMTDYRLVEFIRDMRQTYGTIGKDKIKPFVDQYAAALGIPSIGKTTIGKLIKRRHMYFDPGVKAKRKRVKRDFRTRRCPTVTQPGYVQMDSIIVYADARKYCFVSILDIFTKYAHVTHVPSLSAKQSLRSFHAFAGGYPYPIHTIQTDNGSEFLGVFNQYLEKSQIKHIFSYPRSPRVNGYIERFNRTVQEECIYRLEELYWEPEHVQAKLEEYLQWYNFKRPHAALHYQAPGSLLHNSIPISRWRVQLLDNKWLVI